MVNKINTVTKSTYFPWLILCLISAVICVGALRHNNETMIKLRSDVYAADKNNGDTAAALDKLRSYVYAHMNTDLSVGNGIVPPIQLSYTYARLQQAQQNNAALYTEAENYCQTQIPASVSISGRGRVSCIADYVTSHGAKPANVPAGLYEFDYLSPRWSPDLAGWSLIASVIFFLIFLFELVRTYFVRSRWAKY